MICVKKTIAANITVRISNNWDEYLELMYLELLYLKLMYLELLYLELLYL
jgi:hypothetical protein